MFRPTVSYTEECLFDIALRFLQSEEQAPQCLYIRGHSYEMDAGCISWEKFEELCGLPAGRSDVFYGTNAEVLL